MLSCRYDGSIPTTLPCDDYHVEAGAFLPDAWLEDTLELENDLPVGEARALDLTKHDLGFLDAAIGFAQRT